MNQRSAARVGEQLAAQANQSARRNAEFHAHAPGMVVHHFFHFAAPRAERFHHDADESFRAIDDQHLKRLKALAVFRLHHDFRLAHHQLVAFAAHGLNQNRKLQFAAREHTKCIGGSGIFDAQGNIGEQFPFEARAQVARSDVLPFAAGKR